MALNKDFMALDRELKEIAARIQNQPLVGSHPVYDFWQKGMRLI